MKRHIKRQKNKFISKETMSTSTDDPINTDKERPIFSFHSLRERYCIRDCEKDELASLAKTLRNLSDLTWLEIKSCHKHGLGHEKIPSCAIKASIPNILPKRDHFLAFRFSGKAPMVGYRDKSVFHILWLDRNFTLYDHGK